MAVAATMIAAAVANVIFHLGVEAKASAPFCYEQKAIKTSFLEVLKIYFTFLLTNKVSLLN